MALRVSVTANVVFGYRQRTTQVVKQAGPAAFQDCLDKLEEGQVVFGHVKEFDQKQMNTCAEPSIGMSLVLALLSYPIISNGPHCD